MGACLSLDEEERRAQMRSEEIDRQLAEFAKQERNVIKILLLGAGESGKSTLVKQMKIIHSDGFTTEELKSFKPTVLDNVLSSMKYVLTGMGILRINLENAKNKAHAQTILSCQCCFDENFTMLPFINNALRNLWNDKGVRLAVARGYEYELNDSALYLFESMDRICSEKYVPTATDVLRARVRTTGIIETHFKINDFVIRMFDVGGQRSERRKWIQCFDDVGALLFVVALSGYDMVLQEDTSVNRLQESLQLFSSICNNRFFINTSMILFLNKLDLFREKILYSGRHLRYYMVDYDGTLPEDTLPSFDEAFNIESTRDVIKNYYTNFISHRQGPDYDVDSGALFAQHKFQEQNKHSGKVIYPHFTTATDTSNVQVVFQVVMDTIVRENLKTATLL